MQPLPSRDCRRWIPLSPFVRRWPACVVVPLVLVSAAGCGGEGAKAVVSGKVTVNGKAPVPGCTVSFIGADKKEVSASVANNGAYTVTDVPVGDDQVVVKGPATNAAAATAGRMPGAPPTGSEHIPPKYQQQGNGLTYTVKSGRQTHDFDLTP